MGSARRRRRLGAVLVAYGATGVLIIALVAAGLGLSAARAREVLSRLETQRDSVVALVDTTIDALEEAQTASERLGATLGETNGSLLRGAGLARSLAGAAGSVAQLGGLDILGQRPFEPLAGAFSAAATEATALGTTLDSLATSLDANATDVAALSGDLDAIGKDLGGIRTTLAGVDIGGTGALEMALLVFFLLLVWLLLPAATSLLVGWRLLR